MEISIFGSGMDLLITASELTLSSENIDLLCGPSVIVRTYLDQMVNGFLT